MTMTTNIKVAKGKYWKAGIQLIDGCTPCSPGCDNCWAAAMTKRFEQGDTILTDQEGRFTDRIIIHPEYLSRFRKTKATIWSVWNDLYHEKVPDKFIYEVYQSITDNPQHTYLIMTKRPQRQTKAVKWVSSHGLGLDNKVWHGLTVCNQEEANEKIPIFLQVPGKKFLSIEPMIGPVNLGADLSHPVPWHSPHPLPLEHINAVILGGETGPGARPVHPDWVRSVSIQCQVAHVPFFFKQWGRWAPWGHNCCDYFYQYNCDEMEMRFQSVAMPPYVMYRIGRTQAGRVLDGRTYNDLPWVVVE